MQPWTSDERRQDRTWCHRQSASQQINFGIVAITLKHLVNGGGSSRAEPFCLLLKRNNSTSSEFGLFEKNIEGMDVLRGSYDVANTIALPCVDVCTSKDTGGGCTYVRYSTW